MNTMNTNNDTMTVEMKRAGLLASWLGCEASEIEEARLDFHGLTIFETPEGQFAVGNDEECNAAVSSNIEDSVWAFRAEFICEYCGLPQDFAEVIRAWQEKKCEGANAALVSIVCAMSHWDAFVRFAVQADGRGHFLASYDGDEIELGGNVYAYRVG